MHLGPLPFLDIDQPRVISQRLLTLAVTHAWHIPLYTSVYLLELATVDESLGRSDQ